MKKILLVEDDPNLGMLLQDYLQLKGKFDVVLCADGEEGIKAFNKQSFDLCILDVMMPKKDGFTLGKEIRKANQHVPIIFATAKAMMEDKASAYDLGGDDYITKPFSDIELLNAVESRIKKTALLTKNYNADAEGMQQMIADLKGPGTLEELAADRNINFYKKKQAIYTEGNHPNRLYYIKKGKVKATKINDAGKELTVGLFTEGDFFGYNALLEETVYKETAEAIEETEIAIIPGEDFKNLLQSNREVMHKFIKLLAKNVTEKENQLLGLAYNSLRKRVADALLTLQEKYQKDNQEEFSIHISREDLANIAGTATESLIRTLSDFKSEHIIEIKSGNISIINKRKLAEMLN